jgi:hypothetical protein
MYYNRNTTRQRVIIMLSVRLPKQTEDELEALSKKLNTTKTELVKQAVTEYMQKISASPYETGKDLFGSDDSKIAEGSVKYKQNIRSYIHEKHSN